MLTTEGIVFYRPSFYESYFLRRSELALARGGPVTFKVQLMASKMVT